MEKKMETVWIIWCQVCRGWTEEGLNRSSKVGINRGVLLVLRFTYLPGRVTWGRVYD